MSERIANLNASDFLTAIEDTGLFMRVKDLLAINEFIFQVKDKPLYFIIQQDVNIALEPIWTREWWDNESRQWKLISFSEAFELLSEEEKEMISFNLDLFI